jgi:hypothetical protein
VADRVRLQVLDLVLDLVPLQVALPAQAQVLLRALALAPHLARRRASHQVLTRVPPPAHLPALARPLPRALVPALRRVGHRVWLRRRRPAVRPAVFPAPPQPDYQPDYQPVNRHVNRHVLTLFLKLLRSISKLHATMPSSQRAAFPLCRIPLSPATSPSHPSLLEPLLVFPCQWTLRHSFRHLRRSRARPLRRTTAFQSLGD